MEHVIKIPIRFSKEDALSLERQSKILNWSYNYLLAHANDLRTEFIATQSEQACKTLYTKYGLRNLLPKLKQIEDKSFLKTVHSVPLKNAALRLSSVIQNFQKSRKGKRKGKKTGWPKFKSVKRGFFSLLYDEHGNGFKVNASDLRISGGQFLDENNKAKRIYVHGKLERSINSFKNIEIKNLRITKDETTFYACFCVKRKLPDFKRN